MGGTWLEWKVVVVTEGGKTEGKVEERREEKRVRSQSLATSQ